MGAHPCKPARGQCQSDAAGYRLCQAYSTTGSQAVCAACHLTFVCMQEDLLTLRQRWRVLLAPQKERTASSAALLQATQQQARLV